MLGAFQDWKLGESLGFMPLLPDSVVSVLRTDRAAALAAAFLFRPITRTC
jgi:hypothetical protein